jgi:hypothetical protein
MPDLLYNSFKEYACDGTIDLDSDTFKCSLFTSDHIPSASNATFADLSGEVSGTGYTAGGATLSNVTWTRSGATVTFDADDPSWTNATITARYAVIYKSGTANGIVNPLVCLLDFGADKGVTGGTFSVTFNANGILTLS